MSNDNDEHATQTIDGNTGKVDPAPDRCDLSSLRDIRIEMAKVYRSVKRGEIEDAAGTKRVYMLAEIGKVITVADLEKRLVDLEARRALPGTRPQLPAPPTQH
jgi:hypothetical protein